MGRVAENFDVALAERTELAMIAVQGPDALERVAQVRPDVRDVIATLKPFHSVSQNEWFIARTGYTGEDGLEIILPADDAVAFWRGLADAGGQTCGLGARETLRLDAGLNLYGLAPGQTVPPQEGD